MPTAMKVKDEKKTNTNIVRLETSISPNWNDIRIFIRIIFLNPTIIAKKIFKKSHKFRNITIEKITR